MGSHDLGPGGPRYWDISPVWQDLDPGCVEYRSDLPSLGRVLRDAEGVRLSLDEQLPEDRPRDIPPFTGVLEPKTKTRVDGDRRDTEDGVGVGTDFRKITSSLVTAFIVADAGRRLPHDADRVLEPPGVHEGQAATCEYPRPTGRRWREKIKRSTEMLGNVRERDRALGPIGRLKAVRHTALGAR